MNLRSILNFRLDEKAVITWMIQYFCKRKHKSDILCEDCRELLDYAYQRIEKCPHGLNKPVCSICKIHCYNANRREKIKTIMRFSGPAIIYRKPFTGIKYLLKKKFYTK